MLGSLTRRLEHVQLLSKKAQEKSLVVRPLHVLTIAPLLILEARSRSRRFQKIGVEVMNGVNHHKHGLFESPQPHEDVGQLLAGGHAVQIGVEGVDRHELGSVACNRGAKAESGAGVSPSPDEVSA